MMGGMMGGKGGPHMGGPPMGMGGKPMEGEKPWENEGGDKMPDMGSMMGGSEDDKMMMMMAMKKKMMETKQEMGQKNGPDPEHGHRPKRTKIHSMVPNVSRR